MRPISTLALLAFLSAAAPALAAKSTSCGSDVTLNVDLAGTSANTFASPADPPPAPAVYGFVSDGGGTYTNHKTKGDQITAIFQIDNCTYDFTTNLTFSNRRMYAYLENEADPRWVPATFFNFDRVGSVPVTATDASGNPIDPNLSTFCTGGVQLDASGKPIRNATGVVFDNYAGCRIDANGQWYVLRSAGVNLDDPSGRDYRLRFNRAPLDVNGGSCDPATDARCATSFVRIYHPDKNTWQIVADYDPLLTPPAPPTPDNWVAARMLCTLVGCDVIDYHSVAFSMTVRRQTPIQ